MHIGSLVAAQMFFAIIPHKVMRRLFPTTIAGVAVLLIGAACCLCPGRCLCSALPRLYNEPALIRPQPALRAPCSAHLAGEPHHSRLPPCAAGINIAGTGFQYWGGGVFCAENVKGLAPEQIACQVPVPPANITFVTGECYAPAVSILWHLPDNHCRWSHIAAFSKHLRLSVHPRRVQHRRLAVCFTLLGKLMMCCAPVRWLMHMRLHPQFVPMCSGNGNVQLPFGSPQYLGIGALVLLVWVFVEIFGSPFFRNIEVRSLIEMLVHPCNARCATLHAYKPP